MSESRARYNVRTGSGTVHTFTAGRARTVRGVRTVNRPDSPVGKADCGAITSAAATLTDEPATCPKCQSTSEEAPPMPEREPYIPEHHHTYQQPTDARLTSFVGGCHQCPFTSHGSMGSVQADRADHETAAAAEVAAYYQIESE